MRLMRRWGGKVRQTRGICLVLYGGGCAPGIHRGIDVARRPPHDRYYIWWFQALPIQKSCRGKEQQNDSKQRIYWLTGASEGSLARKHHFSSWLSSVMSIP